MHKQGPLPKKIDNLLMIVNVIILFILWNVQNKILSVCLSCVLAFIVIYNIILICYKVTKGSFFVQAIPCALCYLFMLNRGAYYFNTFNHSFDITAIIISFPILIAVFVCIVSSYKRIKSPFIMSLIAYILISVLIVGTVFILNISLSTKEPYIEEYILGEEVDSYEADHATAVSTKTFLIQPKADNTTIIEELTIKQSFEPNESDVFAVQIWPGLFADVFKIIEKVG